jgi:hypothetical protein
MLPQHSVLSKELTACAVACNICFDACLDQQELNNLTLCIRLNRDCADICLTTVGYISRGSRQLTHLLRACEEIAEACAAECAKHNYEHCQVCEKACRSCADACRSVTVMAANGAQKR